MDMFAWTRKEAVLYNGIIICCIGFESILVFLVVKVASKRCFSWSIDAFLLEWVWLIGTNVSSRVGDRPVLLAGLAIIFCGFFVLLPWGNHFPQIQWAGVYCADSKHRSCVFYPTGITRCRMKKKNKNLVSLLNSRPQKQHFGQPHVGAAAVL